MGHHRNLESGNAPKERLRSDHATQHKDCQPQRNYRHSPAVGGVQGNRCARRYQASRGHRSAEQHDVRQAPARDRPQRATEHGEAETDQGDLLSVAERCDGAGDGQDGSQHVTNQHDPAMQRQVPACFCR